MESKKEIIISGLNMRKNYIMTGNCFYTVEDVKNVERAEKSSKNSTYSQLKRDGATIKALCSNQMKLIIKIDDIIEELING